MTSNYPGSIDDALSIPILTDNVSRVNASSINKLRDAILVIEAELGTNPAGISGTVKDRLGDVDTIINSLVSFQSDPSGITADRPASPFTGKMYFDTTLGQPVWWNGSNWVNSSGISV